MKKAISMGYLKFINLTLKNLLQSSIVVVGSNPVAVTPNSKIIEMSEPNDLKLRPVVGSPKCPTGKLSQLIDILLRPFL